MMLFMMAGSNCVATTSKTRQMQSMPSGPFRPPAPTVNYSFAWAPPENFTYSSTAPTSQSAATEEDDALWIFEDNLTARTLIHLDGQNQSLIAESAVPPGAQRSHIPSMEPTIFPSQPPSLGFSPAPTSKPSCVLTLNPSPNPSKEPTKPPTVMPSALPSSSPTIACHDHQSYRSPINGLTCEDHRGTNCVYWRVLGLNTTELKELIEKCPETCQIPCGSFVQFSISLGFTISKVPGLMDASTKNDLEIVTEKHLLAFIRKKLNRKSTFDFDKVELVSQALHQERMNRHSNLRRLQTSGTGTTVSIEVRMEFEGFTIGISTSEASKLLISGIDSETFTVALEAVDEFFVHAIISSAGEQKVPYQTRHESNKGASPAAVVLVMLFSISVLTFGVWLWIHHRRSGKWLPECRVVSRVLSRYGNDDDFESRSPLRHGAMGTFSMSSLPSLQNIFSLNNPKTILSFDDSRASTQQARNGSPLLRLFAGLGLSRSISPNQFDDSGHQNSHSPVDENILVQGGISLSRSQEGDEIVTEHPLSNIIPPMIVIDHIDNETNLELHQATKVVYVKQSAPQVPVRRMEASNSFLSALRTGNRDIL